MSAPPTRLTPADYSPEQFIREVGRGYQLADDAAAGLVTAYRRWQAGDLTTDALRELLAELTWLTNSYVRGAADLLAARGVALLLDRPDARPLGQTPHVDADTERTRLAEAAGTLVAALDEPDADLTARLERFGRAETVAAMQEQAKATYAANGAPRWYRGLNAGACKLCQSWATGGTFPADVVMLHHPACTCVPIPTTERNAS